MKSSTILAAVLVAVLLWNGSADADFLKKLNNYLIANVHDDDAKSNMEAAAKWIQDQESVKQSFFSRTSIEDLKRFAALKEVMDDKKCDHEAYEIEQTNEKAVGLFKKNQNGNLHRRVDKMMLEIFRDHAMECSSVYPYRYPELKKQVDGEAYSNVKYLSELVMDAHRKKLTFPDDRAHFEPDFFFGQYILNRPNIGTFRRADLLHEAVSKLAARDPNNKYLFKVEDERKGKETIDKDKIKELVRKHLIKPCQQYEAVMGPDLFGPATFDLNIYYLLNEKNQDYYVDWSYYMICRALTKDEEATFADVIKTVSHKFL